MTAPERVLAKPIDPYATYIPHRIPEFKTHRTFAHAKNAVTNRQGCYGNKGFLYDMVVYSLSGGEWYLPLLTIAAGSSRKDYPDLAKKAPTRGQVQYELDRARRRALNYAEEARKASEEYAAMLMQMEREKS